MNANSSVYSKSTQALSSLPSSATKTIKRKRSSSQEDGRLGSATNPIALDIEEKPSMAGLERTAHRTTDTFRTVERENKRLRQAVGELRSIIQCDACTSVKRAMAVAQCGHALCVECLDGKESVGDRLCPYCRQRWELVSRKVYPLAGVADLLQTLDNEDGQAAP